MSKSLAIKAAGVVTLREAPNSSGHEVLVVHRAARQDWSLPKGKLESGEHAIAAAVRECDEETGFTPVLMAPLPTLAYSVSGRPKIVHYWRARVRDEEGFAPDDEVDEIRWVNTDEVDTLLTYPSDMGLVREAVDLPDTIPLVIVRHTQALKRSEFKGALDIERPLTGKGRTQSKALIPLLDAFGPMEIHTSSAKRCYDTVKRLAKHVGTEAIREEALTEESHHDKPKAAARRAAELAAEPIPMLICSHRPVLPTIMNAVATALGLDPAAEAHMWDTRFAPGSFIIVHRRVTAKGRMRVVAVERHDLASD